MKRGPKMLRLMKRPVSSVFPYFALPNEEPPQEVESLPGVDLEDLEAKITQFCKSN